MKLSQGLEQEIQYKLDIDRDGETFTRADALKELMQDMEDPDHYASEFKRELEDFGAAFGIFKSHTKEQIDQIISTSRKRKYDFKRGRAYYVFDSWKPLEKIV